MNNRVRASSGIPLFLATLGLAAAIAVTGCAGNSSAGSGSDTSASSAQGPGGAAGGRHMMAQALASVGLTDDQKAKIRDIMKSARAQNANADPATRRANFKAAMAKVNEIMTPDQRAKFQAKLAQLRGSDAQPAASAPSN